MSVKVKICGITRLDDAVAAVEAGANALGFVFYEGSPRNLTSSQARAIISKLPPFVAKVGVFVNATEDFVRGRAGECGLDTLQFHGDETPEFCRRFAPMKVVKSFRIRDAKSLAALEPYDTDAWLLDSHVEDKLGGTGVTFNWELAWQAKDHGRPVMLAGGLTPENVAEAIHEVWPFAVDVSSGVEDAPGLKNRKLVQMFIANVRAVDVEQDRF
ncbi:MAG: phosphoribosylanthranilate isomerase [Verrucomicrobia bacterium]|nr:phosphoribosylanthranilate isomerase [Verrucomicrobiota bacterium]